MKFLLTTLFIIIVNLLGVQSASASTDLQRLLLDYTEKVGPAWASRNEDADSRHERIKMIIDVINERAELKNSHNWGWSTDDLTIAIFVKTFHESGRFQLEVHTGKVRGDKGRSVCLGQIMYGGNKLVGVDRESTTRCIDAVIYHLTLHRKRCLRPNAEINLWTIASVFAGYGSGYSCNPLHKNKEGKTWAINRANLFKKLKSDFNDSRS